MRKAPTTLTRRLCLLALAASLAACATPERPTAPGGTAAAPAQPAPGPELRGPVPVALLVPLGSQNERVRSDARAIVNAAQMALAEGGAGLVDLQIHDTRGEAGAAADAARRATGAGARLILGPLFGANTPVVGEVAAGAGVKAISFSTDTAVAGDPVWVSGFTPEGEVVRILDFASRRGISRVGVYAPDVPTGAAAVRGLPEAERRSGVRTVARMSYPRSFRDIERTAPGFAADARAAGAEAVLLPDSGEGLAIAASYMAVNGLQQPETRFLGIGQWQSRSTLMEPSLRGGWFAGADPNATEAFAERYRARYGARPPFIAVLGYDGVRVATALVEEARRTRSATPFAIAALTRPEGFGGAVGPIRFLPDGTAERGLAVLEVREGRFDVLEPAQPAFGAGS